MAIVTGSVCEFTESGGIKLAKLPQTLLMSKVFLSRLPKLTAVEANKIARSKRSQTTTFNDIYNPYMRM